MRPAHGGYPAPYGDRIRRGDVEPWVDAGDAIASARASAHIVQDELDTLAGHEVERRIGLEVQRQAWLDRAALLEEVRPCR